MTISDVVFWGTVVLYFVPSFVALIRRHNNKLAIFVLNLLGGWTVVGWVVAAAWACTRDTERRSRLVIDRSSKLRS